MQSPELAVLSLPAHAEDDGAERIACATMEVIDWLGDIDEQRAAMYYEYLIAAIGAHLHKLLEQLMIEGFHFADSALAKRWLCQGEARGRATGQTEGQAKSLVRLLTKRFGPIADDTVAWILSASVEQLERGTDLVLEARCLEDVLACMNSSVSAHSS